MDQAQSESPTLCTAAQIAVCLDITPQAVRKALKRSNVAPHSKQIVAGNETDAYRLADLPAEMQDRLGLAAHQRGYRDTPAMLAAPPELWQPQDRHGAILRLADIAAKDIEYAGKLKEALAPSLARQHDTSLTAAEMERFGIADYLKVFGYTITDRHFRALFSRTLQRDAGAENWTRLEIYLPERCARKQMARPTASNRIPEEAFYQIRERIGSLVKPMEPTPGEVQNLWRVIFETMADMKGKAHTDKECKRAMLGWIWDNAQFLAPSKTALERAFNRKLAAWFKDGAAALVDKRAAANAQRRVKLSKGDVDKIAGEALYGQGGDVAPAWRKLQSNGQLECSGRYTTGPASKDYVPEAISREVKPLVETLLPWRIGPRKAKVNGAYIEQDWSDVAAGDWFTSDDATLEVYYYIPDGQGWFTLTRGQFLPLVDCRSKCILDFILIPEKSYTGLNIRTLLNHCAQRHGLPRKGYLLENGTWRSSKLVGGALPWDEMEMNFATRLGLKIKYCQPGNSRGKIVENVLKLFQATLRDLPGWVGSNEQVVKIEEVQGAKLDVAARRKHPAEAGFLSFEQFQAVLTGKVEAYNATAQESHVMGGNHPVSMSPNEAWRLHQRRDAAGQVVGLCKLPESCRYLMASHVQRCRIGRNGVSLFNRQFTYCSAELLTVGRVDVTVYFDPEMPDLATIMTDEKQMFTVPRLKMNPAMDATPEEMEEAMSGQAEYNKHLRARISEVRAAYQPPVLPTLVDKQTAEKGLAMAAQREQFQAEKRQENEAETTARKMARQRGLPAPSSARTARTISEVYNALNSNEKD